MFDGHYQNLKKLEVRSLDVEEVVAPVSDEEEEVDFTNPESRALYTEEVFERVSTVIELSNQYFKRASAEHTLRDYDKVGLQNTALIRAFYGRFQAQCSQLEMALEAGSDVSAILSQLDRSYNLIEDKIQLVNDAIEAAHSDVTKGTKSEDVVTESISREEATRQFQTILHQASVPETEISRLTEKSIGAAFADTKITSDPELLNNEIKRILENAQKQVVEPQITTGTETEAASEVIEPAEEISAAVLSPESTHQSESIKLTEIDSVVDQLNVLLPAIQQSEHQAALVAESNQVRTLRGKLLGIKRRIQAYQEPHSIENDPRIRALMLQKAQKELLVTQREATECVTSVKNKIQELQTPAVLDTQSEMIEETVSLETTELQSDPTTITAEVSIEAEVSQNDLFGRAQELTAQIVGHEDAGTVDALWENYNRLTKEGGKADTQRQLLESIIRMTESVGLTKQAFSQQLEAVILTPEERHTATMLYEKYLRNKQQGVTSERLAQDIADIKNFLSSEGVGVETILHRVEALAAEVDARDWINKPDESVSANLEALILNVRRQAAVAPVDTMRVQATFTALQDYYRDALEQQAQAESVKNNAAQLFERSKTEYQEAVDRLASIRSAIATGSMPQRAVDEFLDAAISGVEQTELKYTKFRQQVESLGVANLGSVTDREKPRTSFFDRAFKPRVAEDVVKTTTHEDVPGVVLFEPDIPVAAPSSMGESLISEVPGNPVTSVDAAPENQVVSNFEAPDTSFAPELFQKFKAEYKPNLEAYSDDYQTWIDGIQGVHVKRFARIFNRAESTDAYEALKDKTIAEVRDLIRSPQTKISDLRIKPEDLEHWRRFLTTMFMVPGIRGAVSDERKFSDLTELGFMYDTLRKKSRTI